MENVILLKFKVKFFDLTLQSGKTAGLPDGD